MGVGIDPFGWVKRQVGDQVMVTVTVLFIEGTAKALGSHHAAREA